MMTVTTLFKKRYEIQKKKVLYIKRKSDIMAPTTFFQTLVPPVMLLGPVLTIPSSKALSLVLLPLAGIKAGARDSV